MITPQSFLTSQRLQQPKQNLTTSPIKSPPLLKALSQDTVSFTSQLNDDTRTKKIVNSFLYSINTIQEGLLQGIKQTQTQNLGTFTEINPQSLRTAADRIEDFFVNQFNVNQSAISEDLPINDNQKKYFFEAPHAFRNRIKLANEHLQSLPPMEEVSLKSRIAGHVAMAAISNSATANNLKEKDYQPALDAALRLDYNKKPDDLSDIAFIKNSLKDLTTVEQFINNDELVPENKQQQVLQELTPAKEAVEQYITTHQLASADANDTIQMLLHFKKTCNKIIQGIDAKQ